MVSGITTVARKAGTDWMPDQRRNQHHQRRKDLGEARVRCPNHRLHREPQ
jgi:hypothetical protein